MGIPDSGKEYMCNAAKTGSWRTDILRIFRSLSGATDFDRIMAG